MSKHLDQGIGRLEVILKVSERCNLACKYCYYFYAGDESFLQRPPLISLETVREVAQFIEQGCRDLEIPHVLIAFHGGEPMLLKPARFDVACSILRSIIKSPRLELTIQTNGTLINEKWIKVFEKHNISVGVSIDGPKQYHDAFRIDHKGRGSHRAVEHGLSLAVLAANEGRIPFASTICVLNATFDYSSVYRYLTRAVGVRQQSYLLPDTNWDNKFLTGGSAIDYGNILCRIFDEWLRDGVGKVTILQIEKILNFFRITPALHPRIQIVVIQDDGYVSIDDSYLTALDWQKGIGKVHVRDVSLQEHLSREIFDEIDAYLVNLPNKCKKCAWSEHCRAGDLENRYSKANKFDNESVFCEGLLKFYEHVATHLVQNGYPLEFIAKRFNDALCTLETTEISRSRFPETVM